MKEKVKKIVGVSSLMIVMLLIGTSLPLGGQPEQEYPVQQHWGFEDGEDMPHGEARGVAYFVSNAGDDGNDGRTWATAFRTIQRAVDATTSDAGDYVYVAGGGYYERVVIESKSNLHLIGEDLLLTFIRGGITITDSAGIEIAGFSIDEDFPSENALELCSGGELSIHDNRITYIYTGIRILGESGVFRVQIYNNILSAGWFNGVPIGTGIQCLCRMVSCEIINNRFEGFSTAIDIDIAEDGDPGLLISDNKLYGRYFSYGAVWTEVGIRINTGAWNWAGYGAIISDNQITGTLTPIQDVGEYSINSWVNNHWDSWWGIELVIIDDTNNGVEIDFLTDLDVPKQGTTATRVWFDPAPLNNGDTVTLNMYDANDNLISTSTYTKGTSDMMPEVEGTTQGGNNAMDLKIIVTTTVAPPVPMDMNWEIMEV